MRQIDVGDDASVKRLDAWPTNPFRDPATALQRLRTTQLRPALRRVSRLTLEITKYCEVGCTFCKYSAPIPRSPAKDPRLYLGPDAIRQCVEFANEEQLSAIVITGGGEPTHEFGTVLRLLREAAVPRFSLYTAGQWATSDDTVEDVLQLLYDALPDSSRLAIRLSVDTFHTARIGTAPATRIVRSLSRNQHKWPRLDLTIRTVLHYDGPVADVARTLGGSITPQGAARWTLTVPDSYTLDVVGMNLIPDGRLSPRTSSRYEIDNLATTFAHLRSHFGDGWPLVFDGGLNIGVRPSGRVYLYGATPEDLGRLPDEPLDIIVDRIARDPITLALLAHGIVEFMHQMAVVEPAVADLPEAYADPPLLVSKACNSPMRLLLGELIALVLLVGGDSSSVQEILVDLGVAETRTSSTQSLLFRLKSMYAEAQNAAEGR
jgi:hypothetical protein